MNELISQIVSQLGITEPQAKGGAGLLFKLAQERLGAGDFAQVAGKLSGVTDLISAAPQAGGAASALGGIASALGGQSGKGLADLATLASGFSKLQLDKAMIGKFIPLILSFVQGKAGQDVVNLLGKALQPAAK
jgi:hypothetical protein